MGDAVAKQQENEPFLRMRSGLITKPGPFIWLIPGLFEFHYDVSPLIQEASSVLTDCLGVPAPIKLLLSHCSYFTPFCRRYSAFVNSVTTNKLNVILREPRASYKTNSINLSNRTLVPFNE